MPTGKDVYKVGITGSYGGMNLGDEAILQSIIAQFRKDLPSVELTVFSRDADDTKRRHQVRGQRGLPLLPRQPQPRAVQELALEAEVIACPVIAVACQRVPDRGEVRPDLMGAAGLQPGADEGVVPREPLHLEMGASGPRVGRARGHAGQRRFRRAPAR